MTKWNFFAPNRRAVLAAGTGALLGAALRPGESRAQAGASSTKIPLGTIGRGSSRGTLRGGHIGGTIGGLWIKNGHRVFFSDRHPQQLNGLVATLGPLAKAGTVEQAIAFGAAIFIHLPHSDPPPTR